MVRLVHAKKVRRVVLSRADRLSRRHFDLLVWLFAQLGTEVVVLTSTEVDQAEPA